MSLPPNVIIEVDAAAAKRELKKRQANRLLSGKPSSWAKNRGLYLWSKQKQFLDDSATVKNTCVVAGHGIGKSYGVSLRICHHLETTSDPFVLVVTPTNKQLPAVFAPFEQVHTSLNMPGRHIGGIEPGLKIGSRKLVTGWAPGHLGTSNMSGLHFGDLLIVVDEADAISAEQWHQIQGMLTAPRNKLLAIANPVNPSSRLQQLVQANYFTAYHEVSVLDTPRFTGEACPDEVLAKLPSVEWLEDCKKAWGEGSGIWRSRVEGKYPDEDELAIIPLHALLAITNDEADLPNLIDDQPRIIGIDVAGEGSDYTVFGEIFQGEYTTKLRERGLSVPEITRLATAELSADTTTIAVVDADGIGAGVADGLQEKFPARIYRFRGAKADPQDFNDDSYTNRKSAAWWEARQLIIDKKVAIRESTKGLTYLQGDLVAMRYAADRRGKILVEKKEDVKKRIGRSTDDGDAFVMACWALRQAKFQASRTTAQIVRVPARRSPFNLTNL